MDKIHAPSQAADATSEGAPICPSPTETTGEGVPLDTALPRAIQLYTVASIGFESGPGWRAEIALVSARSDDEAAVAFRSAFGYADNTFIRADLDVFPGIHRPLLQAYFTGRFLNELKAQWPFTGGLSLRWTLNRG